MKSTPPAAQAATPPHGGYVARVSSALDELHTVEALLCAISASCENPELVTHNQIDRLATVAQRIVATTCNDIDELSLELSRAVRHG